ncbi:ABC transporter ATP-binding protein [Aeromicrobium endophyticum]|uniref:ABC transporter ATP-binding protein n=1 Tax=Aeromicrobium endophyticum TaxID=2292704 RepID=A0A371PA99_9ACTN|nr:ABC transporter ATP-binding protein [Aeromicrobium endophyticum]REK72885.1 ABC transporter ATP-binding protein [Aeromicrobium endophyticum]
MTAIELRDLRAGWRGVEVVHGLDLTVEAGEVALLLGPNGSGKTTTLLTVAGVLPAMGGSAHVLGKPVRGGSPRRQVARGLAMVPEHRGLFSQLTGRENLRLRSRGDRAATSEALATFPALEPVLDRRAGLLSGGEQQMLALACALTRRPRALVIDELTLGLAPIVVKDILPVLRQVASTGVAVLLVEQHVHAALAVADRCVILRQGRVAYSGSAAAVRDDPDVVEKSYFGAQQPTPHQST